MSKTNLFLLGFLLIHENASFAFSKSRTDPVFRPARTHVYSNEQGTTILFPQIKEKSLLEGETRASRWTTAFPFSRHVKNQPFFDQDLNKILISTDAEGTLQPHLKSGLLSTIALAYSHHLPLKLRPDDIWLTLTGIVSRYIDDHSEKFRDQFVDPLGKKSLEVKLDSPYLEFTTTAHWDHFLDLMSNQMRSHIKDEDLKSWFVPNFSTTTPIDRTVGSLQLMSATPAYFQFGFTLACGLPKVTLAGTLEDWQEIRRRADKIATLGEELLEWYQLLIPILDQLIASYQGQVQQGFWETICTRNPYGSGGEQGYSGWFLVFAPFSSTGRLILKPDQEFFETHSSASKGPTNWDGFEVVSDDTIEHSMVQVPVIVDDHGQHYDLIFYGGVALPKYNPEINELSPSVDWAMIQKKSVEFKDMVRFHENYKKSAIDRSWNKNQEIPLNGEQFDQVSLFLLKFSYHAANQLRISNLLLKELSTQGTDYLIYARQNYRLTRMQSKSDLNNKNLKTLPEESKKLLEDFYAYLGGKNRYIDLEPKSFNLQKAFIMERRDEIIESFYSNLNSI